MSSRVLAPDAAHEVVLAAARLAVDDRCAARLRHGASLMKDWDRVLAIARRHRVVPFVARHVAEHAMDLVPPEALLRLEAARLAVAAEALESTATLVRLLRTFREHAVPVLPYKGPALSLAAYGDVALRATVDLDFVVPPRALDAACGALRAAGYRLARGMTTVQARTVYGGQGHLPFLPADEPLDDGRGLVELHWRFVARRFPWSPDIDEVMARGTVTEIGGERAGAPEPTDLLLLLLLHGTRHVWEQLEWIVAVAELVRRGVDGDLLMERAAVVGGARAALVGLEVARRTLEAPVPERLAARAQASREVAPLVEASIARLFSKPRDARAESRDERAFYRACLERPLDRARFEAFSVLLPTPREWELVQLPGALAWTYPAIRLARLALRR